MAAPKLKPGLQIDAAEEARLKELYDYDILDTPDDSHFDQIAQIAAAVFQVPIAVISLVDLDRQWFKAKIGVPISETPRDIAFCHHAIQHDEVMIVDDATKDLRFHQNPMVTSEMGLRFYAGAPLITPNHQRLGTLCVLDQKPRSLTPEQANVLKLLSKQVMDQLELKRTGVSLRQKNQELRVAQEKLKESSEFLKQIVNHLPVGLYCKDASQNFSFTVWNEFAARRSEIPVEQAIGKTDYDFNSKEQADWFRQRDLITLAGKFPKEGIEEVFEVPGFGRRHVLMRQIPLKNKDGQNQYVLGLMEDVTQKKETQALLLQNSKMSSLGEMAAGIAHEINNPLAAIRARAQMMSEMASGGNLSPEAILNCAQKIDETSVRISKIIAGLRNFARQGQQDPYQMTSIKELIESVMDLSRANLKNKGIDLRLRGVDLGLQVECRSGQIVQVLINLINNAVDAVIEVSDRWIGIEFKDSDDHIEILVSDSGRGIPENLRDKVMLPFFTTKEVGKGTGLGLSISKGIIESHKGTFVLDTTSARTCFVLRLPKVQSTAN
jgi:PAS domain S-box-containing protein